MNEYTPELVRETPEQLVERLQNQITYIGAHLESWKTKWDKAREYLQASIDREEWTTDELSEPFWEELADMFDLDLKRTKEVWLSVTVKYSGSVEVPYDFDESLLEVEDTPSSLDITYNGETLEVQCVTYDEQEVDVD